MLRIYDANFNRCSEGLRVLEEIARFLLNDSDLTTRLKHVRHRLADCFLKIEPQLFSSRDSVNDIGITSNTSTEYQRDNIPAIVVANSRRVQESLRVMEEFSKLPEVTFIDSQMIEKMRFELYTIERELTSHILRKGKAKRVTGVYLIIDYDFLKDRGATEVARQAIDGGVGVLQLRDKQNSKSNILETAKELKQICAKYNVLFIINDYIDIALAADADGVHLGHADLPVAVARKLLPIDKLIGRTASNINEAISAQQQGADYIAVGSIYPTQSKINVPLAGLETLSAVKQNITGPVVAVGGINMDNIKQVLATNTNAVAVISVILGRDDVKVATSELVNKFKLR
jgi:thiamine-phosphate pyrophosphorylase